MIAQPAGTSVAPVQVEAVLPRRRTPPPVLAGLIRAARNPMGLFGLIIVGLLVLIALGAPWLSPYDPLAQHPGQELLGPSWTFPLGTDAIGRDLLSRILWGARPSFIVSLMTVALGGGVGILTGLMAGYLGGWVDIIMMRVYDALFAFPPILTGIAVLTILGPGTVNVAYALAIAAAPGFARLTRSVVLGEKTRDYVLAAQASGCRRWRIMLRHVLPNSIAPLLVQLAIFMAVAVLAEAGLSFLGLGTRPPTPSWGEMLNDSRAYLRDDVWMAIWPGIALALLLVGLNFLADALRDALDPRRVNA
jgi:ABC-type dipeptide/oligopeptide/nickel transport system permease subunit